jgi:hypothetical protein
VQGARSAGLAGILLDRAGTQSDVEPGIPIVADLVAAVDLVLAGSPADVPERVPA